MVCPLDEAGRYLGNAALQKLQPRGAGEELALAGALEKDCQLEVVAGLFEIDDDPGAQSGVAHPRAAAHAASALLLLIVVGSRLAAEEAVDPGGARALPPPP